MCPPLRDFSCDKCHTETYDFIYGSYDEIQCPKCGNKEVELKFSYAANYTISGDNGGSTRPSKQKSTGRKS